ncbi:MAG: efflux RND transporter periplasmic adaptor subunit [Gammaproteobacteria bacterium]
MKFPYSRWFAFGGAALFLVACGKAPESTQQGQPPTPEVAVVRAHAQSVPLVREVVGRLAPTGIAQVRARVAGIILKRVYTEGTDVKQGQVLFRIDPAPLQATLDAQQAALAQAKASATNAAVIARRYRNLFSKGLLSQQDLDTALATERTTAAAVKQAQANVATARLNLGYATVTAPISGRAGRSLVTEGALVGQDSPTELTTVEQIDPIYVNFSQSMAQLEQLQQAAAQGKAALASGSGTGLHIMLPDGAPYPHAGRLDFSDLAVAPDTGTVSLRGIVPNPDHRLLPGMFVTIRVTTGRLEHAYLLPQAALERDGDGAYVLVVNGAGKVEQKRVQTHGMTRSDWIVTGKLADGDQVIVSGLQKVRPGATAKAVPAEAGSRDSAKAPSKP